LPAECARGPAPGCASSRARSSSACAPRARGEIARGADPAALADFAGAVLHSLALRARAGDPRESLRAFSRAAVALLCGSSAPAKRAKRGSR